MTVERYFFFVFTTNKIISLKGRAEGSQKTGTLSQITVFTCIVREATRKQDVCKHQLTRKKLHRKRTLHYVIENFCQRIRFL